MVLKTEVFLRENILDTSLIQTLFHVGSSVPRMNMHALLSAASERASEQENAYTNVSAKGVIMLHNVT